MTAFRALVVALIAVSALLPVACGSAPGIVFIPDGGTYTTDEALARGDEVGLDSVAGVEADEAPARRQRALADLRSLDASASALADLITSTFPSEVRAVPLLAEGATVGGRGAWIIVEAWGGREGPLEQKRVWILERTTGKVLSSAIRD